MNAKEHIVGFRVDNDELKKIKDQVDKEHICYISALIRKATFWYIEFMNTPDVSVPKKMPLKEEKTP